MRSFRNNNKRGRFRNNDRNFKRNGETAKYNSDFSSNLNFKRKIPGRNNHNASKLIEKYTDLAREALSNGDKILSENYFQHADHFMRILSQQENSKSSKIIEKENHSNIEVVSDNTKEEKKEETIET
tara:strand:+ start:84 stop:464 length:381 start_codon:yes stop_codon:yes gene_type:complete